jgi:transcriptional regulator with XRE-family HTH domain
MLKGSKQPHSVLALVSSLEGGKGATVLAAARLHRQLSQEQAARRSGITVEQVGWLEEGRVYAFRSPEDALAAAVLLASALEIDNREARELAGLPVHPRLIQRNPRGRLGLIAALIVLTVAAAVTIGYAVNRSTGGTLPFQHHGPTLPATFKIKVAVVNGAGDMNFTRQVASRIAALGYQITSVTSARRFTYKRSNVFFSDTGKGPAIGARLAKNLGVEAMPLPDGHTPLKATYVVGPPNLAVH